MEREYALRIKFRVLDGMVAQQDAAATEIKKHIKAVMLEDFGPDSIDGCDGLRVNLLSVNHLQIDRS